MNLFYRLYAQLIALIFLQKAISEATDLVDGNKQLKRKIEPLITQLENPDGMKMVELHEERDKWKLKAKRLQVIKDALCGKDE
ncbi:unnamed protein product [Dovyalis caffra]|uniref:Uncharacterized protein n=1 Tax=Dovyalis caffra TaxID=77055 RepID=A0AAV1RK22_9ROSI|nr:unnamed protein product [Dovyalis caffra]